MPAWALLLIQTVVPALLQEAEKKGYINELQRASIQGIADTEEFLGSLEIEEKFPTGVNGQSG